MKKKIILVSAIVALVAIALVGSSLAFFNDSDEKVNVFTVGTIDIEQHETDREGNPFEDNGLLIPVINKDLGTDNEAADARDDAGMPVDPNFRDKIVTVENVGSEDAFVRTYIAVPKALDNAGILKQDIKAGTDWKAVSADPVAVITRDGIDYNVYAYYYDAKLASADTTEALLNGVYLDWATDLKVDADGALTHLTHPGDNGIIEVPAADCIITDATSGQYKINVLVATEGVQARGFADAKTATETAFGAFSAMTADAAAAHFAGFWN